ncbi:DUF4373 domain-containing protein [Peribacillus sp. NPDC096448]|uniref:DUF4373 domain-containing protein n=1 Tax=Peribacillus sp. NPDC096448 TaxID=3364395 RepID=UPI00381EA4B0
MARPKKEGLDYFPLDVDMDQDDKIALIEAKHGVIGFGITLKLLMKIYKEGYFYRWTEREQLLFSSRINVNINAVQEIVIDCINWGLFDKETYDKYEVLTSKGIQTRYIEAIVRRKSVTLHEEFLLIDYREHIGSSKISITLINTDNKEVNVNINCQSNIINGDINPQSKVKESKVKESNKNNIPEQIENLRLRYSKNQLKIIDDYLEMIRHTRVSAKISPSVILGMYQDWDKHPTICVEYGLKIHTENPAYHSKKENYTSGIIRNTPAEEAAEKLAKPLLQMNTGTHKKQNSFLALVEKGG